ncbi:MAG: serpin family protein [Chloroflexi bacterium]|nr:serpin family protein [Chloroflexota bacterium]
MAGRRGEKELTLRSANAPFGQHGWTIEPSYLEAIASAFGAGLRLVDYSSDAEAARKTINDWVSDQTAKRIPMLLGPPDVTPVTRLVLVNAIYLKAQWMEWFHEDLTRPAPFARLDGSTVDVPMMRRSGGQSIPYARGSGWQATELRYRGPDGSQPLAMTLVLPEDLVEFEAGLSASDLDAITGALADQRAAQAQLRDCENPDEPPRDDAGCYPYSLVLSMPRFGIDTRAQMTDVLTVLGMPLAFDPNGADFTAIHAPQSSAGQLFIATVIHQANIDVDEKGTEAAAATAVGMDTGGGPSATEQITLRLDRPFLFFLRDVETGAVLFMGRVTDPSVRSAN